MKLFSIILLLSSLGAGAQTITGGSGGKPDPFTFKIISGVQTGYNFSSNIKTSMNEKESYIKCLGESKAILYSNSLGHGTFFDFDNMENCQLVLRCSLLLDEKNHIIVKADRKTKKLIEINLPEFCSLDPLLE